MTFFGDGGWLVKQIDIWPLFGLKRFDLNRKWLHRKPKRQVWINLNFMHLQKNRIFRKMSFWGHLEIDFRQELLHSKHCWVRSNKQVQATIMHSSSNRLYQHRFIRKLLWNYDAQTDNFWELGLHFYHAVICGSLRGLPLSGYRLYWLLILDRVKKKHIW